jgi:hypothetical protein
MGLGQWLQVLDTLGGLAQLSGRWRRPAGTTEGSPGLTGGPFGQLEARLAGVVVAALKEAFDRDRARMDLEREHLEAERARAEAALEAEVRRQAAERALGQLRLIAVMALATWMLSAALGVWLPGMRQGLPRVLMGIGWAQAIAALGCAFVAWQHVSAWSADMRGAASPRHTAAAAAPWLLLGSMAFAGAALLQAVAH